MNAAGAGKTASEMVLIKPQAESAVAEVNGIISDICEAEYEQKRLLRQYISVSIERNEGIETELCMVNRHMRLSHGFAYIVAVIAWYSRYVLSWELSVTIETAFCV
jgi:hypothetical protein